MRKNSCNTVKSSEFLCQIALISLLITCFQSLKFSPFQRLQQMQLKIHNYANSQNHKQINRIIRKASWSWTENCSKTDFLSFACSARATGHFCKQSFQLKKRYCGLRKLFYDR